jgi:HD-GYP domain-containing protein (c-di-GMP phosphodiesterase class II)
MSLRLKLLSLIGLVLLASLYIVSSIYVHYFRDQQKRLKYNEMERLGDLLQKDIEECMLSGRPETLNNIIENYRKIGGLNSLRIIDDSGVILSSHTRIEVGRRSEDYLNLRPGINNHIYYIKPIRPTNQCRSCHRENNRFRMIEMKYELTRIMESQDLKLNRILFSVIISFGILSIIGLILSRLIFNPINKINNLLQKSKEGCPSDSAVKSTVISQNKDEINILHRMSEYLLEQFKNLVELNRKLEKELSDLRTELKYMERVEEINRELQYKFKRLESTNRALEIFTQEAKHRLISIETNIKRFKKTGEIVGTLSEMQEWEEVLKNFIKYIVNLLQAERGIIYIIKNNTEFIFNYVKAFGFSPDFSAQDKDILSKLITNKIYIIDIHPASGNQIIGVPVKTKSYTIGAMLVEATGSPFTQQDIEILMVFRDHLSYIFSNLQEFERYTKGYASVIESVIGHILEENRFYEKGHSNRIKRISLEIGKELNLLSKEIEILEQASGLCDIGKLKLPYRIFNKKGPLTVEEFDLLKTHPARGAEFFDGIIFFNGLRRVILQHHERYDGSGYPEGLKEGDIDIKARIIHLTDAFEAMMSDRPYRPALSLSDTLKEIETQTGHQFDPDVVRIFFKLLKERPSVFIMAGYPIE